MKVEDLKEGMIVVTKKKYVYVVHKVRDYPGLIGVRATGWASFSDCPDDSFSIDSVFVPLKPWSVVKLYESLAQADWYEEDEKSLLLLLEEKGFEQIYPKVRYLTREEAENRIGFPFKIIGE